MKTIENNKGDVFYKSNGTVKSFDKETGYGFILSIDEPGKDIYVHATQIIREGQRVLNVGETVEFLYKDFNEKGLRAFEVRVKE